MNLNSLSKQVLSSLVVWTILLLPAVAAGTSNDCSNSSLLQIAQRQDGPPNPIASLKKAKFIYVKSSSLLVGVSVIEDKLRKRPEFQQSGLLITRDANEADIILELHHDLFTMYVFTAVDPYTNVVVASGKLSSLGGTVAGKVAKRFMKQVMKARLSP